MKGKGSTIIFVLILLVGLSLLLYPAVSEYWNSLHQSRAIASYVERIAEMDEEEYRRVLESAQEYNKNFVRESLWMLTDDEKVEYEKQLNIANNGIMGYELSGTETINGNDSEAMHAGDDWDLTLFTCNYTGNRRYTLRCIRV